MKQSRTCTNPPPMNGGLNCAGDSEQTLLCNPDPCRIDGKWSAWANTTTCIVSCGGGSIEQSRTCTNPAPQNGGANCQGPVQQTISCSSQPCPRIDGGWSEWTNDTCSATCNTGKLQQTRTCTNPAPANGGVPCVGNAQQFILCNTQPCPVNGQWTAWANSSCSAPCGTGSLVQSRACTNHAPTNGGLDCTGSATQSIMCNTQPCPINGQWSTWIKSTVCTAPCGGGTLNQTRTCTNPAQCGGNNCPGAVEQVIACNTEACPLVPGMLPGLWS